MNNVLNQDSTLNITRILCYAIPILILIMNSGGSIPYHLLVILALATNFIPHLPMQRYLGREERIAIIGYVVFGITIIISLIHTGGSHEAIGDLDTLLRPLWAALLLYLFIRIEISESVLWYGLAAGAIVAGVNAIYEFMTAAHYIRVGGATSPNTYGNLALIMGFLSAMGLHIFSRSGHVHKIIPLIALILGSIASLLSGSRGSWLVIPVLIILLVMNYWRPQYRHYAISVIVVLPVIILVLSLMPQTGVVDRISQASENIELYMDEPAIYGGTSVGQRLELWRAAWHMFIDKPLLGGGIGHSFNDFLQKGVENGQYHPATAVQTLPHNIVLDTLALRGLVGLSGLAILWGLLLYNFYCAARELDIYLHNLGMAGISLILAYFVYGLTDSPMEYGAPLVFFSFYTAIITYLIAQRRYVNEPRKLLAGRKI